MTVPELMANLQDLLNRKKPRDLMLLVKGGGGAIGHGLQVTKVAADEIVFAGSGGGIVIEPANIQRVEEIGSNITVFTTNDDRFVIWPSSQKVGDEPAGAMTDEAIARLLRQG